jgi:WD40 repeat protein
LCAVSNAAKGTEVWAGYDSGTIRIWGAGDGLLRSELTGHKGAVSCLSVMGTHVWSGSADHTLCVWNISTRTQLLSIPDQGGYVRCAARIGWVLWSFTSANVKVWAAASVSDAVDSEKLALEQTHRSQTEGETHIQAHLVILTSNR